MNLRSLLHAMVAACALMTLGVPVPVEAEPPAPPGPTEAEPLPPGIPLRQWGRAETLELRGANVAARFEIPVPRGVTIARVSGQLSSPINVDDARIEVLDADGIMLGDIPIPSDASDPDFSVDTAGAVIDEGVLVLDFVLRSRNPPAGTCEPAPSVTLNRLTATPAGRVPDPTTVADFLPAYLDTITIWTGPDPTPDQQQAALTLTAILTRNYRPLPVRIEADATAPAPPKPVPGRRVIAIRESENAGVEIENPGTPQAVLAITGRGRELTDQVALFVDRRLTLAQSGSARVTSLAGPLTPTTTTMTFEDLGIAASTTFSGKTTVYTGFDGAAFAAGPIESATVKLKARYTPTTNDQSSVMVRSGAYVLATRRLDASGSLDLEFEVPPQAITSDIGMALELQYFPGGESSGGCGPITDQMTFAVDPQSTVEVTPGAADADGFTAFPAAFTPEFDVAVDRPELIGYAAQAINLIAQRTGTLLRPQLVSIDDGAASGTPLLAVTTGEGLSGRGLDPPVGIDGDGTVDVDGPTDTGVKLDGPIGLVQSFADNGRAVLAIAVPSKPRLADDSLTYIRRLDNGWSSLSGDVVATGAAGDTVSLSVRPDRTTGTPPASRAESSWSGLATLAAGAGALLLLIRGLISRRRRQRG